MKIKMYSTKTCYYCVKAKEFFKENKIEFEEIDLSSNPEAINEMVEKSGQTGVPVIEIDGKIIVGFDKEAVRAALGLN